MNLGPLDDAARPDHATTLAVAAVESPPCAVCGSHSTDVIADATEVRRQLAWLKRFHLRRLKSGPSGQPPRSALEDRADFTQGFATNIVACRECGLVYRDPRPSDRAIEAAYAHDHYGEARLAALFESQHELYRDKVAVLRRWLGRGVEVRVIEVGSFVGGFLAAGQSERWSLRGIDPGDEVATFCERRGLPVFHGTLEDAGIPARSIDCVAIWNTFDQLPDPAATLEAIRGILRPRGIVAVRFPNGRFFRYAMERLRRVPGAVAAPLRATLAWNNLLGFPYLHGYAVPTLDRLLARYRLGRIRADADTLVRLSDDATRSWAALEERALKLACRSAWTLARGARRHDFAFAPWIDVYYRLTA